MKRTTPSLDEALCIAATTGARVRAVFTFSMECLGGRADGASLRLVAAAEAACGHPAESLEARDDIGAFVVTAGADLIEELCRHPAVTTGSVFRPESELVPTPAAVPAVMAAA